MIIVINKNKIMNIKRQIRNNYNKNKIITKYYFNYI